MTNAPCAIQQSHLLQLWYKKIYLQLNKVTLCHIKVSIYKHFLMYRRLYINKIQNYRKGANNQNDLRALILKYFHKNKYICKKPLRQRCCEILLADQRRSRRRRRLDRLKKLWGEDGLGVFLHDVLKLRRHVSKSLRQQLLRQAEGRQTTRDAFFKTESRRRLLRVGLFWYLNRY